MTSVVFCEDEVVIQRLIQAATRSLPYTVFIAPNGAAGLELIDRERPVAVFTDLAMPGIDGRQLVDALKARPDLAGIPIVVMTASGLTSREIEDLLSRGAADYLPKPFGPKELRAKLARVLPGMSGV